MKGAVDPDVLKSQLDSACLPLTPRLLHRLEIRVLLLHEVPKNRISCVVGCHPRTVTRWQQRLQAGQSILDHPRNGRPKTIPAEVTPRIISFYCQHNPLPGCSRWSLRWAHSYLDDHPEILQCSVSRSSLHRLLNAHAMRPHKRKYFLQISDPLFFEKMEHIIQVYQSSYEYLFCLDECTGVQALERVAPPLPAKADQPAYHEPEYIRHGAVSFLSVLHVSQGQVFTQCIPDHTSPTILACVQAHARQFPQSAELHYILDNYSSHSTQLFCEGIAELCDVPLPKLKTLPERRQWLQCSDKRITFHFLPSHGSWLNLIEVWFGILTQKAIKDESFPSTDALCQQILDFTDTWDLHFAHPFEWTYTGDGLHGKVIRRFVRWLQMESPQLSPKFLDRQIRLMSNLAANYRSKAHPDTWSLLQASLLDKHDFIQSIIAQDPRLDPPLPSLHNLLSTAKAA